MIDFRKPKEKEEDRQDLKEPLIPEQDYNAQFYEDKFSTCWAYVAQCACQCCVNMDNMQKTRMRRALRFIVYFSMIITGILLLLISFLSVREETYSLTANKNIRFNLENCQLHFIADGQSSEPHIGMESSKGKKGS